MRRIAILLALVLGLTLLGGCRAWDFSDPFHPVQGNRNTLDGCTPCARPCCPSDCDFGCGNTGEGPGY
jgi:hypothetical protein